MTRHINASTLILKVTLTDKIYSYLKYQEWWWHQMYHITSHNTHFFFNFTKKSIILCLKTSFTSLKLWTYLSQGGLPQKFKRDLPTSNQK